MNWMPKWEEPSIQYNSEGELHGEGDRLYRMSSLGMNRAGKLICHQIKLILLTRIKNTPSARVNFSWWQRRNRKFKFNPVTLPLQKSSEMSLHSFLSFEYSAVVDRPTCYIYSHWRRIIVVCVSTSVFQQRLPGTTVCVRLDGMISLCSWHRKQLWLGVGERNCLRRTC